MAQSLDLVLATCLALNIRVNVEKSELRPSQLMTYLGMTIDSVAFRAFPSEERIQRFSNLAEKFLSSLYHPASHWESLLGMMSSLLQLVPGSRLRMRPLQFRLRDQWPNRRPKYAKVMVNLASREAISWWLSSDRLQTGVSLEVRTPSIQMWTDASLVGWGGHTQSWQACGQWTERESSLHINILEIRAMRLCLQKLPGLRGGEVIALQGDNTTALAYIKNLGGTRSSQCYEEAKAVWLWAEEKGVTLVTRFVAGCLNVEADALSRKSLVVQSEWVLNQWVCKRLWALWGSPSVDLFATSQNNRVPLFFSPLPEESALGTDAFLQDWDNLEVYAYPPTKLLRRVIQKLRDSPGCVMTLIAPWWEKQPWFPDLVEMSVDVPRGLPIRKDLLHQTYNRHVFCHSLETLQLTAWRLSSTSTGRKVWVGKQPRPSQMHRSPLR